MQVFGNIVQVVRAAVCVTVELAASVVITVLVADDIAVNVSGVVELVVSVLGRFAVCHDNDVVFLAPLLHG